MEFKKGDRVIHDFYGKGTVIDFGSIHPLVEFDKQWVGLHGGDKGQGKDKHCWYTDMIKRLDAQTIVVYPKGLETIALFKEGNKIIKQATAKCNPSDTYDFNIGARLAFSRLVGGIYIGGVDMAIDIIREVKRPAKVGEWIKVVNADEDHCGYKNGDVLKVKTLYPGYEEEGVVNNPYHIVSKEYVVLENYQPEATIKTLANYTDKELIDELAKRWEGKA